MPFTKAQIVEQCKETGPYIAPLPEGIDGAQLFWAISGVESSFGANVTPRHEPAFDTGGIYGKNPPMPDLIARFGSAAACSYGPWQVMLCNAPAGTTPYMFNDLFTAANATLYFLNTLLRHWKPKTLDEIGECWNTGHITPDPNYTSKLRTAYATIMPAA